MGECYMCVVFLADGKTVSECEGFYTAIDAIEKAAAWRKLGHIAKAYRNELDLENFRFLCHPIY